MRFLCQLIFDKFIYLLLQISKQIFLFIGILAKIYFLIKVFQLLGKYEIFNLFALINFFYNNKIKYLKNGSNQFDFQIYKSGNVIANEGLLQFGNYLENCRSIQTLILFLQVSTGNLLQTFAHNLGKLLQLQKINLYISESQVRAQDAAYIYALQKKQHLENSQQKNIFFSTKIYLIFHILFLINFQNLIFNLLIQSKNIIGSEYVDSFSQAVDKLRSLTSLSLNLASNNIQDNQVESLLSGLANYSKMSFLRLELSQNMISDEGVLNLGSILTKCKSLTKLILSVVSNHISDPSGLVKIVNFSKKLCYQNNLITLKNQLLNKNYQIKLFQQLIKNILKVIIE
ncbi:transmembrane protein, putative (macronuclear) [Tetrahymena thermophila SB210]|uniref:Transmembrane protein, putative n=1 Tax=Tetrahymena thermophila (strain SB210) TaxID=312017 RepID=Q22TH3_TETTS|nr:transmembrane protein, putative [Tetrahymena thermophila SB210]EAR88465.2 transmembrane protein, putative [Tetrahymena thermophila SB210]|eukprot:XP_001008710.2 transmembrane protein, putative [Tetrahymena thermophila SB210]